MKISWPHMGSLEFVMGSVFEEMGVEYVLPPPNSQRTLELGARHGPEFACFPLKTTLGNFIEAIENGADTLIMVAGRGPCRFGFYAETQRRILADAGYEFEMVPLEFEPSKIPATLRRLNRLKQGKSWISLYRAIKFALSKAYLIDRLERQVLHQRYLDRERGATTAAMKRCYDLVWDAGTYADLARVEEEAFALLHSVPRGEREEIKIGIVGEFYLVLEPFFNLNVEEQLGDLGAFVERNIYLTDWLRPSGERPVLGHHEHASERLANPYLTHKVGGEGIFSIGDTVLYNRLGFDGVVQLMPFTCMPETIAKSILPLVSRDLGIPVLSLVIDEMTGRAGVATRLEAFTDLARFRRRASGRDPQLTLQPAF
ncbi:MAG: CoA protein activase [Actinomycetota bacterium]|nr:CoA protein activase [Actinomycetota bacterium]MDD5666490.1 CoA protein activase [Actinomycetota bacterium]